jgi:GT2 family glycosyltransferase
LPSVSVFIASYNHAKYIGEALDSVLGQSYQDLEIVVVDDGSTDGSHHLLLDYQRRYPETIRYSWHEERTNLGVTRTSNAAIAQSRGRYLAWLGSDDLWVPDKLAKQVDFIERHPGTGMVCSHAVVIDENGDRFPGLMGKDVSRDALRHMLVGNAVCASTVLISRGCLNAVGWFNESLDYSDWELFIRIAARSPIGFISEPLACYRVHGRNMSLDADPDTKLKRNLAVLESVWSTLPDTPDGLRAEAMAAVQFTAMLDCFAAGRAEGAQRHFDSARCALNGALPVKADELIETVSAYAALSYRASAEDQVRFVRAVFACVAPALEAQAVAHFHIARAFTCHLRHDLGGTRHHLLRALRHNPRWLRNGGVRSVGADAFLGSAAADRLRGFARAVRGRAA